MSDVLTALMDGEPPRATAFIVTVYGDVVVPRGGVLAMTTLIEVCADVGISESLVRTAVSRLVAAGRLTGERSGRRSFYRLTPETLVEFQAASQLIYSQTNHAARGWLLVPDATPGERDVLSGMGFRPMTGSALIAADHGQMPEQPLCLRMEESGDRAAVLAFAGAHFEVNHHGLAYRDFVARFRPVLDAMKTGKPVSDAQAVAIRLLLVHHYRTVLLRDPRLPERALPDDWPGAEAQWLFGDIYQLLSPQSERHIGRHFLGEDGLMASQTDETVRRAKSLEAGKERT